MKIIAIEVENEGLTSADFQPYLKDEAEVVWELYKKGVIREIHFREDRHTAVLIMECKNVDEAKSVLDSLPLVQNGLITFDIIPLKPYPGFERLFNS
ncbi:muconolactone Delta-isomerase family protein [Bacteroidota bacterium]